MLATILISLGLLLLFGLAIRYVMKKGACGCNHEKSGGCNGGCAHCSHCAPAAKPKSPTDAFWAEKDLK